MINVWDTVINLPMVCIPTDILFEQWIGQFILNLISIRFTYSTTNNPQESSRLSGVVVVEEPFTCGPLLGLCI